MVAEPVQWDSAEGMALAASAAEAEVASASPKTGVVKQESPKTGVAASRVQPTSKFAPPPPAPPGQPLIAARSSPIDALNPYTNKWQIKVRARC